MSKNNKKDGAKSTHPKKSNSNSPETTVLGFSHSATPAPLPITSSKNPCSMPDQNKPLPNQKLSNATPEQERAAFALKCIKDFAKSSDEKKQKEFNSYASAMPFMIHANGLGQTAAFYRRKGTVHTYYKLYALLGDWLNKDGRPFAGKGDLLDAITQSDQDAYLAAQIEALLFLDWVKKLASAFLAREDDNAGDQ
ncbi:type III-B CRISPR module-associated protein Cmr5 [Thiospirillum jenense]|uniref:CRISPR type III-B/RAMP module-associated protein Cmr5 n=1 Tax=Thiospirillum jenense TaxID=1653858 RepID=A0A839HEZ1_9GAMM|nr:type III-B CRISPR module-associated protein Cmr5 [Thiospirillum jenense]MBB1126680.1 type III-B CRISPR module-associated protein Cmr5 [Thiospirillum jenense]